MGKRRGGSKQGETLRRMRASRYGASAANPAHTSVRAAWLCGVPQRKRALKLQAQPPVPNPPSKANGDTNRRGDHNTTWQRDPSRPLRPLTAQPIMVV